MTRLPILAFMVTAFFQVVCLEATPQAPADFEHIVLKTGKQPGPVAFGDFNRDGRIDIAIGNEAEQTVSIFLNEGNGRFAPAQGSPLSAGPEPHDIAVADVNNDGKFDLVIANHGSPYVTVLLGKGDGTFVSSAASPIDVHVRPHPHGVAVGDFNHDGRVDLAVESWADNEIKVFLGDGRGGFHVPGESLKVGKRPYQRLRAADLNGDGNPDIVTTNFDEASVSVLLGDGKGSFQQASGSPFPAGDDPFAVVISDFNHDGKPDLAVANMCGDSITLLLNHQGRFDRVDIAVGHHPEGIGIAPLLAARPQSIVVTNRQDDTAGILTLRRRQ